MYHQSVLPRWRGFNLEQRMGQMGGTYQEENFRLMSELGFNFVRLALNYKQWINEGDWNRIDEEKLAPIDQALAWGKKYGLHVNLSFYRGPGYSISTNGYEPFRLFRDEEALQAFLLHWRTFASRYKSSGNEISFNLLNEPQGVPGQLPGIGPAEHAVVMRKTIQAIREIDPERLILLDGLDAGQVPPLDFFDQASNRVAVSMRAFFPGSDFDKGQSWNENSPSDGLITPKLPGDLSSENGWEKERLHDYFKTWGAFAESAGMGLHCGVVGCSHHIPHAAALAWLEDVLIFLKEINTGLVLSHFHGAHGLLNSNQPDVAYEDWHGHKLDRAMYDLLQKYW